MRLAKLLAVSLILASPVVAKPAPSPIAAAVADTGSRGADNVKLDDGRKPTQVLTFLKLRSGQHVLDRALPALNAIVRAHAGTSILVVSLDDGDLADVDRRLRIGDGERHEPPVVRTVTPEDVAEHAARVGGQSPICLVRKR